MRGAIALGLKPGPMLRCAPGFLPIPVNDPSTTGAPAAGAQPRAVPGPRPALRRGLGPLALLATMTILQGAAPYGTEEVIPMAGPGLALLVMAGMAVFWALPYVLVVAELVSAMPDEGGIYRWLRAGMGPFWSFTFSILDWITYILDGALYPPMVTSYLLTLLLPQPDPMTRWIVCLAVIWICAGINIRGIRLVGGVSMAMSVVVLAPMVAIIFLALPHLTTIRLEPFIPPGQSLALSLNHALVWALWHYSGYGALATAGEEIVDTPRNYPRMLAVFLPLNAVLFVMPLLAGLVAVPEWASWKAAHFNQIALVLGGTGLAACMALGAQVGAVGIFNASLLSTSRMAYAMARDRLLPRPLTRLHPRFGTPYVLITVQAVLYSILTYFFTFIDILIVSTWLALPVYLLQFATPIVLRLRRPDLVGRFRIPGGWTGVLLATLPPSAIAVYALATVEHEHILTGLMFAALGPILYLFHRRRRSAAE